MSAAAGLFRSGGIKPGRKKAIPPCVGLRCHILHAATQEYKEKEQAERKKCEAAFQIPPEHAHINSVLFVALGGRKELKRMPRSISGPNLTLSGGSSTFKPGNTLPQRSASSVNVKPRFSLTNLHQTEQDRTLAHTVQVMGTAADEAGQHTKMELLGKQQGK